MKKILFVVGNYKNGGVPMRVTNLANEFGQRGYQPTILVTKEIADHIFFELHENVTLVSLKQFIIDNRHNKAIAEEQEKQQKEIKTIKRIRYVSRFCKKWDKKLEKRISIIRKSNLLRQYLLLNQEAVLIPFGLSYYEQCYYAAQGLKFKIIYAERNAPELEVPSEKERADELLEILKNADGAIFQTRDEAAYYKPHIEQNTVVIHNPVKKNLPKPFVGERRKTIVNYCRISKQKNLVLLVDAFKVLHKNYPEYTLEIYGNAVEESEKQLCIELIEYVKQQELDQAVHILPPTADVHERVKDCAMFVSSSDFEGLSNSMIEAMAIGLPCVCTDCLGGGAREMIIHGENGLLVPANDKNALYEGMKQLVENKEFARRCGRNASKIAEELSVEKIANQWLEVIERV